MALHISGPLIARDCRNQIATMSIIVQTLRRVCRPRLTTLWPAILRHIMQIIQKIVLETLPLEIRMQIIGLCDLVDQEKS